MATKRKSKSKKKASAVTSSRAKALKPARASKPTQRARAAARPARVGTGRAKTASRTLATQAPMFQKVAFTMFGVVDATRARAFYEGVLGMTRGLASPDGVWTEYDLPGGGCLALFCHPDPKVARAPGGASVAFEVSDLDALNRRLVAAGVVYEGDVVQGPRCRMSNILDSEGNAIILHQNRQMSAAQ